MFSGFSQETFDFLWGIRLNNERGWFLEHKEQYRAVLYEPMAELADECLTYLGEKRPGLVRKVSRIYRDARRLHGRGPFKDHLWFSIERPSEDWTGKPTFYFELTPEGWSYGLGYWRPSPALMARLRARIDRDPETMEKLTRRLNRSKEFTLDTVDYRRPRSHPPSPLLEPWYRGKTFTIMHEDPPTEELYGPELAERLKKGFRFLLPYYDYFKALDAEMDPASDPMADPAFKEDVP